MNHQVPINIEALDTDLTNMRTILAYGSGDEIPITDRMIQILQYLDACSDTNILSLSAFTVTELYNMLIYMLTAETDILDDSLHNELLCTTVLIIFIRAIFMENTIFH
jgi:hypothetical protein